MANFTQAQADACTIAQLDSVKTDGVNHDYYDITVVDADGNYYTKTDNVIAEGAADLAYFRAWLTSIEKLPAPAGAAVVIDCDPNCGATVGSIS